MLNGVLVAMRSSRLGRAFRDAWMGFRCPVAVLSEMTALRDIHLTILSHRRFLLLPLLLLGACVKISVVLRTKDQETSE